MNNGNHTQRIVLLSDNEALATVLAFDLQADLNAEVIPLLPVSARQKRNASLGRIDLMVMVLSLPTSEPLVALAEAALSAHIGQIPLLISSDRPFRSAPEGKIFYLDFPFNLDRLTEEAQRLLNKAV